MVEAPRMIVLVSTSVTLLPALTLTVEKLSALSSVMLLGPPALRL